MEEGRRRRKTWRRREKGDVMEEKEERERGTSRGEGEQEREREGGGLINDNLSLAIISMHDQWGYFMLA